MPIYATFQVLFDDDNDGVPELDISADVVSDISGEHGSFSPSAVDFLSNSGSARFDLNNVTGAYTALPIGRQIDIKVIAGFREKVVFSGKISPATIDAGEWGNRRVHVVLEDWLKKANNNTVKHLEVSDIVTADEAMELLIDSMSTPPAHLGLEPGVEIFDQVFDAVGETSSAYSEMDRLVKSELAFCYLRFRENTYGETIYLENQHSRSGLTSLTHIPINDEYVGKLKHRGDGSGAGFLKHRGDGDGSGFLKVSEGEEAIFNNLQQDTEIKRGDYVVNRFAVTDVTRTVDASPVELFSFVSSGTPLISLGTGETAIFSGTFSNPDERAQFLSARDAIQPVPTADYLFNSSPDGSGSNLTANIVILDFVTGSNGWTATIKNLGAPAHCTKWIVRGYGVYKQTDTEYVIENQESIQTLVREERSEALRREYSGNRYTSKTFADGVVALNRVPGSSIRSFSFQASSSRLLNAFMYLDIGAKVQVIETQPAKDGNFYLRGIRFRLHLGGVVSFQWYVDEAIETRTQPITVRAPLIDVGRRVALDFGILPYLANMPAFTYSVWVKKLGSVPAGTLISRTVDLGTGRRGNFFQLSGANLYFSSYKSPTDGEWVATSSVPASQNVWFHVVLTYDNTSASADPLIYVDAVSKTVTEQTTPSGTSDDDSDCPLILFNISPNPADPTQKYYYSDHRDFAIKDVRIYNRILSGADISTLAAGEDDYSTVPDGLLFQGIYAPRENIADYIDDTIENGDLVLDVVHQAVGIPYSEDTSVSDNMLYGLDLT